jgi:hypothetical protein
VKFFEVGVADPPFSLTGVPGVLPLDIFFKFGIAASEF